MAQSKVSQFFAELRRRGVRCEIIVAASPTLSTHEMRDMALSMGFDADLIPDVKKVRIIIPDTSA